MNFSYFSIKNICCDPSLEPSLMREMSFKGLFLFFNSGGHLVHWDGTIQQVLYRWKQEHFCEIILNLSHGFERGGHSKFVRGVVILSL